MTDLGLYSGWYAQLSGCAELVDSVLVDLIAGTADTERRRSLAQFLLRIAEQNKTPDLTVLQRWFCRNTGL